MPGFRGCSSVGRAPALQAGGQGFESLHLHESGSCASGQSFYLYLENYILYDKKTSNIKMKKKSEKDYK